MGQVAKYVEEKYGAMTTVRQRFYSVGTTPLCIALNDPDRFELHILNAGSDAVGISLSPRPFGDSTFILGGGGGSLVLTAEEDGELPTYEFWAVAAPSSSFVNTIEVVGL